MKTIKSSKLALAIGVTGSVLYLACICLMLIVGQNGTIWFFNSILHGLDVSTVSQINVPIGQSLAGIILTFGIGWISGFMIALIYNWKKS